MKSHKLLWLLCTALCFIVACKKEVDESDNLSAVTSQSSSQEQFSAANFLFVKGLVSES